MNAKTALKYGAGRRFARAAGPDHGNSSTWSKRLQGSISCKLVALVAAVKGLELPLEDVALVAVAIAERRQEWLLDQSSEAGAS